MLLPATAAAEMALLPVDEAVAQLLAAADAWRQAHAGTALSLPLAEADGRILAADVMASLAVPPEPNSAMDGYAIRHADLTGPGPWRLPVSQRIAAGRAPQALLPGTAARIFTGAVMPSGADTVVMQENCQGEDGLVSILQMPDAGANVRAAGQDIAAGSCVVAAGTRLSPAHLGLLASIGCAQAWVWPRLRAALLCTGDELVEPGLALASGQIYNSNRVVVSSLLQRLGIDVLDLGPVADTLAATTAALRQARELGADLILSTGGVSVGEEDHVRAAVMAEGCLDLWKVAIKPGKPLAFGHVGTSVFLGLPGNPQSVWVTFAVLARPFLRRLQGETGVLPKPVHLPAGFARSRAQSRREYLRVRYEIGVSGLGALMPHGNQSSGVLSSAVWADGLALIEAGTTVSEGQLLPFLAWS